MDYPKFRAAEIITSFLLEDCAQVALQYFWFEECLELFHDSNSLKLIVNLAKEISLPRSLDHLCKCWVPYSARNHPSYNCYQLLRAKMAIDGQNGEIALCIQCNNGG